jgi:hypothetical protein
VWQIHDEKVRPLADTRVENIGFSEVYLGITGRVHQRHEHLFLP